MCVTIVHHEEHEEGKENQRKTYFSQSRQARKEEQVFFMDWSSTL